MINKFKTIQTRDDFLLIRPFDIQAFLNLYFTQSNITNSYKDYFSKLNDCLFPITELLGFRAITNIDIPYLITSDTDFIVLEGTCKLEVLTFSENESSFDWLSTLTINSSVEKEYISGDKIEIKCARDEYYLLRPKTRCFIGHWNYQTRGEFNIIDKYKSAIFNLTDQGRKLIKLSKNIYINDSVKVDHELRDEFYQILSQLDEKDLFFIFATKSFLIFKNQQLDFNQYFKNKHPHL